MCRLQPFGSISLPHICHPRQTVMRRPYPFAVTGIHLWDVDVAGSNPVTPTTYFWVRSDHIGNTSAAKSAANW
jgi:hypothetical protein